MQRLQRHSPDSLPGNQPSKHALVLLCDNCETCIYPDALFAPIPNSLGSDWIHREIQKGGPILNKDIDECRCSRCTPHLFLKNPSPASDLSCSGIHPLRCIRL